MAFSDYEIKIKEQIKSIFKSDTSKIALLTGNPSSGKSILSYSLAKELQEENNEEVIYVNLQDLNTKLLKKFKKNIDLTNRVFIIDNIHLKLELAVDIYNTFEENSDFIALFIGRDLNSEVFRNYDILNLYEELKDKRFRLKSFQKDRESIRDKIKIIINSFQEFQKDKNFIELNYINLDFIMDEIGDNLVLLYYYLVEWKKSKIFLDKVNKNEILRHILEEIKKGVGKENFDYLLECATLYQFEIKVRTKEDDRRDNLIKEAILKPENRQFNQCNLYHSNYAKLIVEAYSKDENFIEKGFLEKREFNFKVLKEYFIKNNKFIEVVDFFKQLELNKEIKLLTNLLNDIAVKKAIDEYFFEFYIKREKDLIEVKSFLYLLRKIDSFESYIFEIIEKIINLKDDLSNLSLLTLFLTLKLLIKISNKNKIEEFKSFIKIFEINKLIKNDYLNILTDSLSSLSKLDNSFAKDILEKIDINILIKKTENSSFENIGKSLNEIYIVDRNIAKDILEKIDINILIQKAKDSSFESIGKFLSEIYIVDRNIAKDILEKIDINILIQKARINNFKKIGEPLSNIQKINIELAENIVKELGSEIFIEKLKNCKDYKIYIHWLPTIANLNIEVTKEIFNAFEIDFFINEKYLKNTFMFNKLFYTVSKINHAELQIYLINFFDKNRDNLIRTDLKNFGSLIMNISHFDEYVVIDLKNKIYGRVKYEKRNRNQIVNFLGAVYFADEEIVLEMIESRNLNLEEEIKASSYNSFGYWEVQREDFNQAIKYSTKALNIFKLLKDNENIAFTYFNLAKNHQALENSEKAIENMNLAIKYIQKTDNIDRMDYFKEFRKDNFKFINKNQDDETLYIYEAKEYYKSIRKIEPLK